MKLIVILSLFALALSCNADSSSAKKNLPISKTDQFVKSEQAKTTTGGKAEEDCDEKAKKPIEIKEDTISLSGNTGCSLDEMKH